MHESTGRVPTTFEEFLARAVAQQGNGFRPAAMEYARHFAATCRTRSKEESPDDSALLRRLADQMDPDLRPVHVIAAMVRDFEAWCRDNQRCPRDPKVRHVTRPEQLRGIRRQRVELGRGYRRLPHWPELAKLIRTNEMLADTDALGLAGITSSKGADDG
ncbi:hypothetical protein EES43_24715 [Streptomyces sp. ADI96-02]|uniref:hypothetical protein n=1 Tax=Streptomyces sp. ADI96-02 TaxID=1522760 RepID=UPI000F553DEF|nr:hypothetical protein [Streptomyces sp. ADI96-02]RPK56249.1 hypothetical protein EES43_24715 [Streptomyces sp. ADI96-02]